MKLYFILENAWIGPNLDPVNINYFDANYITTYHSLLYFV